jgi:hypothetical protein
LAIALPLQLQSSVKDLEGKRKEKCLGGGVAQEVKVPA